MTEVLLIIFAFLTVLTVYLAIVTVSNFSRLKRLGKAALMPDRPLVSILVPARNEERNVQESVRSLLQQSYAHTEILVLDDHSSDNTAALVQENAKDNVKVRLLSGNELPSGWLGKHWACHQLAQAATGELLLFVDADTTLEIATLQDALNALHEENADLLSLLPTRLPCSWLDASVFLVIDWAIHAWLPFAIAHSVKFPFMSVSFGQFMLFRRSAYEQIGGYEAIRENVVDDVELGRQIKAAGLKWRLYDGSGKAVTKMYTTPSEVLSGLGKNIFRFFGRSVPIFAFTWLIGMFLALVPVGILIASVSGSISLPLVVLSGVVTTGLLGTWLAANMRFGHSVWKAFLYPLAIVVTLQVALWSMVLTLRGRTEWKGRAISGTAP
ncbi:MAG: glycosyltransferase family 2 protein [Chloroflexi bacterium]|nr:glycosyltransferase family 2 protein [Chloroflexota bacterium]